MSCIGVCCFLLAARIVEEECNVPSTHDVIRISQCKCTASDIKRMEKIISEKLHYELEATTALNFLHLYHTIVLCHTSERSVGFKIKILYFSTAIANSEELLMPMNANEIYIFTVSKLSTFNGKTLKSFKSLQI